MLTNADVLLHISLISGIGPTRFHTILARMTGALLTSKEERLSVLANYDLTAWYQYTERDFIARGVSERVAQIVVAGLAQTDERDRERELIARHGTAWVTVADQEYPDLLHQIHTPPIGIYVQGVLDATASLRLAVVGSRQAGTYAQKALQRIVAPCVQAGWQIVSGGALGVDGMAHALAVQQKSPTMVVLGSGLLRRYPHEHNALFDRVLETGGALISPFTMLQEPDRGTFPARNRIIAGMSDALLVVQAAEKSGALISAQYALDEGRIVAAVPGSITDPLSAGCHGLLRQGAVLVTTAEDLFHELQYEVCAASPDATAEMTILPAQRVQDPVPVVQQNLLYARLQEPQFAEVLALQDGCSLEEIEAKLFELQLDGVVEQLVTGAWQVLHRA